MGSQLLDIYIQQGHEINIGACIVVILRLHVNMHQVMLGWTSWPNAMLRACACAHHYLSKVNYNSLNYGSILHKSLFHLDLFNLFIMKPRLNDIKIYNVNDIDSRV